MSDGTAAPAAVETSSETVDSKDTTGAPEKGSASIATPPRSPDDDFDEVLKKAGGLTYKAGGKEKKVTAAADLRRLLSRVDGTDNAAQEASKKLQKYEEWEQRRQSLSSVSPKERAKLIDELLGEGASKSAREAWEDSVLAEAEQAKQLERLSPQERHLKAELEARDAKLKEYQTKEETAKKQQEQDRFVQQVQEIGAHLEKLTVAALTKAKISPDAVPYLLPRLAEEIERSERLGLGTDETELAERVAAEHDNLGLGWLKSKPMPDLIDAFESMGLDKAIKEEFARRIKAKLSGIGSTPGYSTSQTQAPQNGHSTKTKALDMEFWRR